MMPLILVVQCAKILLSIEILLFLFTFFDKSLEVSIGFTIFAASYPC